MNLNLVSIINVEGEDVEGLVEALKNLPESPFRDNDGTVFCEELEATSSAPNYHFLQPTHYTHTGPINLPEGSTNIFCFHPKGADVQFEFEGHTYNLYRDCEEPIVKRCHLPENREEDVKC